jgi:glutamate synthase domain-containing protein 2/glutamate synthase domain-containing protein 1/glutamate synthase domain-containing protein 3
MILGPLGRGFGRGICKKIAMNECMLAAAERTPSLYNPDTEHDACGVGFIAKVDGQRSNRVLRLGLQSLCNLGHRGALDADAKTGDGAGLLTQLPYNILRGEVSRLGHHLFQDGDLGVGFVFLPHDNAYAQARAKAITEEVLESRGLFLFGWRGVPTNINVLGEKAQLTMPRIEQVLIGKPWGMSADDYERRLFLARNEIEKRASADKIKNFYIASLSSRVIIYKGLLVSASLEKFYRDLSSPDYQTAICIFHQRYSTNTFPTWPLGQPFRMLGHNGEINTLRGNRNWMHAREAELEADFWGRDIDLLKPIIQPGGSDSASLDNALEALVMSGRNILHAMTMLVPSAWRGNKGVSPELAAYYEYHSYINEPWDGPAALVFSDGVTVGACLDRNGLRPARYKLTEDGILSLGSEVGVVDFDDAKVIEKGRLGPGEMIAVDTAAGKLLRDADIKEQLASRRPYRQWIDDNTLRLETLVSRDAIAPPAADLDILGLTERQIAFGYSSEELDLILKPMLKDGAEPYGSMGDDTALAVLSLQPRLLYTYFCQLFAQVTNPPIDPLREKLVMSLQTVMGWRRNLLGESPEHAQQLAAPSPILMEHELAALVASEHPLTRLETVSVLWPLAEGAEGLEPAIQRICAAAERAVDAGCRLVVLSDRGVDHAQVPVPMLLATGAVHHHLTRQGKRMRASILCETGEARDVHQMGCLLGYGASAIIPYLGFETCREILEKMPVDGRPGYGQALQSYRSALEAGVLKMMSKMGISVLASYRGAQMFEAIGLSSQLVAQCFTGTSSQIEGIGCREIAQESLRRHALAFGGETGGEHKAPALQNPGFYRFRPAGEIHAVTPPMIKNFHTFVQSNKPEDYKKYVASVTSTQPISLRDLLELVPPGSGPVPLEEVEPVEEIRRRFTTAGMSLGALSPEMHECLAIAMNRIGGKSNSGEGGEDPARFHRRPNGDLANSAIKQIASGRFGVNATYLASAKEIEIKMAQGAKPGEGGQLPGHKVSIYIARLRKATPGVALISPPPHHDIYSIEDLAQLIFDLKQVNPRARVCVKLVAEAGVGTIAAGVAKAHADIILVSGHEGGTGAAAFSSIKNAGSAWELGIAEVHQVLMLNGLRNRVTLRTDGGMRTGMDIVFAALLGAEEFNFGTAALIASGCVYVRQCHLNTCPVGVATLDEKLRAKFRGKPENIVNFFNGVAGEVREIMAGLGARTVNELIGRVEMLRQRQVPGHPKANTLDLRRLLTNVSKDDPTAPRFHTRERNDGFMDRPLDDVILQDANEAINLGNKISLSYKVRNANRAVGTKVSGEIAYQHGEAGLPEDLLELNLTGTAGQSLAAFLSPGIRIVLTGEANDYVAKSMSGGMVVIKPRAQVGFVVHESMIAGNTCLYGATGGHFFAAGRVGERFAVRNSGATAVVEGLGDHGCEYMTNGTVVVLGRTGRNFAAGMTGGVAYVLDLAGDFETLFNPQLVRVDRLSGEGEGSQTLKSLIYRHLELTDSARAREILGDWPRFAAKFWQVSPLPPVVAKPVASVTAAQAAATVSPALEIAAKP